MTEVEVGVVEPCVQRAVVATYLDVIEDDADASSRVGDDENNKQFDIYSVITVEQHRRLRCAAVPGDDNFSNVGEELFVWRGWKFETGFCGATVREGHIIAEITSITLDS